MTDPATGHVPASVMAAIITIRTAISFVSLPITLVLAEGFSGA